MYKIELANSAAKELEKIYLADQKLYSRLIAVIESLPSDPFQGKKLKGQLKGDFSIRVGHYRIIYSVHKEKLIIYIIALLSKLVSLRAFFAKQSHS